MPTEPESLFAADPESPANRYSPADFEAAAQGFWRATGAFEADEADPRPKYYCLSMLPYPSGALHMGHVRNYTIGDVISRFKRMRGYNVLQPMGWDAFGLPAENAAIKHGVPPAQWTYRNIEHMREQLERMGFAYDWRREFATCRPDYYRHEQAMFCELLKKGLAYRRNAVVNWDPVDETVLANEQVIDGRGWRSGALVEKREIPQWFLRITDYAAELLDGLDRLDGWPDAVRTMQRNWIGRSEGLEIRFDTVAADGTAAQPIEVFTTRPDTLMGVTFLSVAAEHPLAIAAAAVRPELAPILAEFGRGGTAEADLATQEKRGVELGIEAVHPLSGERLPVYAANFVLMGYGTGAVMGVPGHDQRDFEFARTQGLPIKMVIIDRGVADALTELQHDLAAGVDADPMRAALTGGSTDVHRMDSAVETIERFEHDVQNIAAFTEAGVLVNSGEFDGLDSTAAFAAIAERLEATGQGKRRINYRLRDWGVSRQRYWGCPIPVIHCPDCGPVPVPAADLPVRLPEDVAFSGTGSPLKTDPDWRQVSCPTCGAAAERDTDTFDTFMESSWYYARYCSPGAETMVDGRARHWLPVDQYIGGIEHAILHLLYFRFYHRLLRDAGFVDSDEPATRLLCQGMVIAETFYRQADDGSRIWFNPAEVTVARDERGRMVAATLTSDGAPVEIGAVEKMSKSKNNGVDPEAMIARFGADTVRLFSMFAAPPDQSLEWNEAGVEGMYRFLKRLTALIDQDGRADTAGGHAKALNRKLHETIAKVGDDYDRRYAFNTAIAATMELTNAVSRFVVTDDDDAKLRQRCLEAIVLMLNPIAPHTAHALWQRLGHPETLVDALPFPEADAAALARENQTLAVQVNGKLRSTLQIAVDAERSSIEAAALADPAVQRFVEGTTVRKIIVVPGKIVNIVCS